MQSKDQREALQRQMGLKVHFVAICVVKTKEVEVAEWYEFIKDTIDY